MYRQADHRNGDRQTPESRSQQPGIRTAPREHLVLIDKHDLAVIDTDSGAERGTVDNDADWVMVGESDRNVEAIRQPLDPWQTDPVSEHAHR